MYIYTNTHKLLGNSQGSLGFYMYILHIHIIYTYI